MSIPRSLVAALLALTLGACLTSDPFRFHVLTSRAAPAGPDRSAAPLRVHLEAVQIAAYLDQPAIVTRSAQSRLVLASSERWGEPLRDAIARVLALDLAALLGGAPVTRFSWERPPAEESVLLSVAVERFEAEPADPGRAVVLEARWSLAGARQGLRSGAWTLPVEGPGTDALVQAMSAALAELALAIAADLAPRS